MLDSILNQGISGQVGLLDGKKLSLQLQERLREDVLQFHREYKRFPALATVLVGDDPASAVYIKKKIQACEKTGIVSIHQQFSSDVSEAALKAHLIALNQREDVDGILLQLPLPEQLNPDRLLHIIDPDKDVDGFHPFNLGLLMSGKTRFVPCTPLGIMKLLHHYKIDVAGKHCVVIGRSNIVGKPMAMLMLQHHATTTICHSHTQNIESYIKQADIVVAAVGKAKFVKKDWIKPGAVLVDVGINRTESGTLVGDVDYEGVQEKCSWITPVPGGVGPLTIAMLLNNTLLAAKMNEEQINKKKKDSKNE